MRSLLALSLLLLLTAAYLGGGSALGRRAAWTKGPEGSPALPSGTSAQFWVRLSPEVVAVPPGDSVWLNCSSSCPLPEGSGLITRLRQGKTLRGPGWMAYQLLDVRAWSSAVRCFITCEGETRWATARVTAYKRPKSVILEPPVSVGSKYMLRCHVTHVFPVGFLVVMLRQGGRVIYSENLKDFTGPNLANVTLTYELSPGVRHLWQSITCHARLNLSGLVVRSSSAPITLSALAWNTKSTALSLASIAALLGILLIVGATYLHKYLAMRAQM
ncbi:intercellular adhesion molecule 4 [Tenrec ecaudatus]|uniref:intercellular adhesion molecule 4 n=1 Tax=Tenrec ecaudatus TaxID=94439 RepID=UPI003F5AB2BA